MEVGVWRWVHGIEGLQVAWAHIACVVMHSEPLVVFPPSNPQGFIWGLGRGVGGGGGT